MHYVATRGAAPVLEFEDDLLAGLTHATGRPLDREAFKQHLAARYLAD